MRPVNRKVTEKPNYNGEAQILLWYNKRMGNTVGSRGNLNWNSTEVRKIRKKLHLSKIQKAVLIGLILGDGCLAENFWKKQFRLKMEQGNQHKEYIFWLYTIFKNWIMSPPKYLEERNAWRFYTLSHPDITKFRKIFYRNRNKIIPVNIGKLLIHPISLAVWFMDDGLRKGNGFSVCVHSFSKEDIQRLRICLVKKFVLPTNIHWDGKGHQLYFPTHTINRLNKLVGEFIVPSMKYKFPSTL